MIPGTSCQATIVLSLRDKSHSPIETPHNDLSGGRALLCAGITTWPALRHWKVGKGQKVGIVGIA